MAYATGIEIVGDTLRCVVLTGSARAPRLKAAFSEPVAPAAEDESSNRSTAERVSEVLKEKGVPTGNVVFALDGRQTYCREVVVPFTRTDQIQKTIKFEAEEFMPAAPVESMVVDHYKVAEIDGKSRVLVCGVQKPLIAETLEFCRKADFTPRALDLDSACLANVGFAAGAFPPQRAEKTETGEEVTRHSVAVALDVSPDLTRLVLVEDGRLRRTRTFKVALDPENPSADTVRKIVREVRRTEASCSLVAPVSIIYLAGPAYSVGLGVGLREELEVDIEHLKLEGIINGEDDEQLRELQAAGCAALGAALKALGADNVAFDFRKEEFVYHKAFEELKAGLACTACLGFFIAFMLAYTFNLRLSQDRYALDTLRDRAKQAFLTLLPGEPLKTYETPLILKTFKDTLEKRQKGGLTGKVPDITSALDIFRDFGEVVRRARANAAKPSEFEFRLLECKIDQNSMRIRGIIKDKLHGPLINKEIRTRSKYLIFDSGDIDEKKGEISYTVRCKVKKPD